MCVLNSTHNKQDTLLQQKHNKNTTETQQKHNRNTTETQPALALAPPAFSPSPGQVLMTPGSAPMAVEETVMLLSPSRRLLVYGIMDGIMGTLVCSRRIQYLEPLVGGGTRYHSFDQIGGLASPIVKPIYARAIHEGFDKQAHALKAYVESRASAPDR
jgi:hypothetical protein